MAIYKFEFRRSTANCSFLRVHTRGQQVLAQALGCLPPAWDFQPGLLTPGSGPTQPWLVWDLRRN